MQRGISMTGQGGEFTSHFSSQFNQELENLRSRVLAMGSVVERQIADAVAALASGNENMARSVIGGDLHVNQLEIYLDDECRRILARRQPAAGDLRLVFAVIKAVTDIERIGDSAKSVARMAIKMVEAKPGGPVPSLQHLGELVREMVSKAIGAFAVMDVNLALEVERADIAADEEYRAVMRTLTTRMTEDSTAIDWALNLIMAARALERAGDHAKNISEYLIYLVQGKDVRHVSLEDRERQVQDHAQRNDEPRKT
jgi:phosphate transport system protein